MRRAETNGGVEDNDGSACGRLITGQSMLIEQEDNEQEETEK
jgi:hypothetical protein